MTAEQRWREAIEAEVSEPSGWTPDVERFQRAVAARLAEGGCPWPHLASSVLRARSHSALDIATFAARLGLSEAGLRALEGSRSIR